MLKRVPRICLYANSCLSLNLQYFSHIYSRSFCEKNQSHALKQNFSKTLQMYFFTFQQIFKVFIDKCNDSAYSDKRKKQLSGYLIPDEVIAGI